MKYRFYDYVDASDKINFPTWVETDTTIRTTFRQAGRWGYRKQNTELDGRWRIVQPVAFTLGAGWERWDRNKHREAPETDELSGKAVLLKAKYVPSPTPSPPPRRSAIGTTITSSQHSASSGTSPGRQV